MPLYHLSESRIELVKVESFSALGLHERTHLQRVLRSNLNVIAPGCFLIAEEFGDWEDARRRIDLLAIDESARLVVIELKRTEDAGHAELQALRYGAMVSAMSFDQAVEAHRRYLEQYQIEGDARARILSFLGWAEPQPEDFGADVRIILAAADFSRELTTSVLWLRDYKIDISCVRVRPYDFEGKTLLNVEMLIPLPETKEYQIKLRERDEIRREAAVAGDRYQKYDVFVGGVAERQLYKRHAIHRIVRALAERGVSPERMSQAVPSYRSYLFVSAPGRLQSEEFIAAARTECEQSARAFDPRRFALRDGELIYFGDRTYAVTNQFGSNTETVLDQLTRAFPFQDVRWERAPSLG